MCLEFYLQSSCKCLMSPSDVAPDTTSLLVSVNKEYNYSYTGKNKNVLNFDLKFNYRFLTPTPLDKGDDTLTKQNPRRQCPEVTVPTW